MPVATKPNFYLSLKVPIMARELLLLIRAVFNSLLAKLPTFKSSHIYENVISCFAMKIALSSASRAEFRILGLCLSS